MTEAAHAKQERRHRRGWVGAALLIGLVALATSFDGFWRADWNESVPVPASLLAAANEPVRIQKPVVEADYHLAVWAVARNAYTLLHDPLNLFQAEPCYPAVDALTLHHPVISPALIAAPVYAVTGDPVLTFNAAILLKVAIGFAAMFLLISDWTRSPPAGIAAALLYAFHAVQIDHPYHIYTSDNAWLLFGLFFARRLFAFGRWTDALGLSLTCWMQTAASFYPFFAAAVTAFPMFVWLIWHHRRMPIPYSRLLFSVVFVGVLGAILFTPYLRESGEVLGGRGRIFYADWSTFLPAGKNFPGWTCGALAIAAFALPRRRSLAGIDGDPRWALAVAALLVALFAAGGNFNARLLALTGEPPPAFALPNPFAALAQFLPGLRTVRLPGEFALVTREIACILAGIGVAGLMRITPSVWRTLAAAVLIALVFIETIGVPGFAANAPFAAFPIRPADESLEFFEGLESAGNVGPLLELPLDRSNPAYTFREAPRRQLLTAYHHRRTSACYVSFIPESVRALATLAEKLPNAEALNRARELGFTTIVIHHPGKFSPGRAIAERFRTAAEVSSSTLTWLATSSGSTAYVIGGEK